MFAFVCVKGCVSNWSECMSVCVYACGSCVCECLYDSYDSFKFKVLCVCVFVAFKVLCMVCGREYG